MRDFDIKKLSSEQKQTRLRILELSYKRKLTHIGSCLSAVDLIDGIYKAKDRFDKFVLSNGHAGIAFYTILEKYKLINNKKVAEKLNIHPDRNPKLGIDFSSGSLGQGLPIALGMAIARPKNKVYCMISDGEINEGSIWETLRIAHEYKIYNLKIIVNYNGWTGYGKASEDLPKRLAGFGYKILIINGHDPEVIKKTIESLKKNEFEIILAKTNSDQFSFLNGQDAHYYLMTDQNYKSATKILI